ncbi:MAG TPA: M23 family metallopeptidase [Tahibacter sp.]|uniref:M23 family metallopeptidase n=1 Tax=Tahibacter sp. TaxID=2056211 RepID=UPI002B9BBBE7|nr:M23 family metallopeptidase [Tahibacter sp.]HSX62753.1 M23 family metallopeptidase [Tahibacter sp.]
MTGIPSETPERQQAAPPRRRRRRALIALSVVILLGLGIPEHAVVPVRNAGPRDWNAQSFWYAPWGVSGVHKGIDIFAPKGRDVVSATYGIVLFRGQLALGGNVIVVLGPRWRLHYYAHLDTAEAGAFSLLAPGTTLGTVGDSGNAAGKPPHLHYTVLSLLPLPWRATTQTQGWKRMFFLDPGRIVNPRGAQR